MGDYWTKAVGRLRSWKAQEEGEYGRMEPRMIKNNSIVHLIWYSTGILNLLPLKTVLSFQKQALHVVVLIATAIQDHCHFVQQPPFSSLLV